MKESVPLKPLKENCRLCLQSASLKRGFDKVRLVGRCS